jgi:hypothetical protein
MTEYEAPFGGRTQKEEAPFDVLRNRDAWKAVAELIDLWASEPVTKHCGYTTGELDAIELNQGVRFPVAIREWWRLAGKHPFVDPGLGDVSFFCLPPNRSIAEGVRCKRIENLTLVAVEDDQTGNWVGIHDDFIHELNPPVHGRNPNADPPRMTEVDVYQGNYYYAGTDLPSLIYSTLLWHICGHVCMRVEPPQELTPGVLCMDSDGRVYDREYREKYRLEAGVADYAALIAKLQLKKFYSITWGEVYTDGADIIYWPVSGWLYRTAQAVERVRFLL